MYRLAASVLALSAAGVIGTAGGLERVAWLAGCWEMRRGATTIEDANPDHDFPQRVIYRRRPDSLLARVEGTRNGQLRGVDFPYRRAECAGGRGS